MAAIYPNLDLSHVVIDDIVPLSPGGTDAVNDETDDSVHIVEEVKALVLRSSFSLLLKAWLLPWSHLLLVAYLLQRAHLPQILVSPMLPHLDFYPFLSCLLFFFPFYKFI